MISAVSGISFRGNEAEFQKLIQSEGKFSQNNATTTAPATEQETPAKKGGKAGKIIGGALAAIVITGLALFGLKRANVLKVNPDATGFGKVTSKLGEVGEWIGTKMIDPILNLFKSKKASDVGELVETLGEKGTNFIA